MTLSARLRELRVENRKSLQDVADAVGISRAHVWNLEKGESANPSMEILLGLANLFNVGIADLVGENPRASAEEPELVALFRNLKSLSPRDRQTIETLVKDLRSRKEDDR